ncbi:MAG: tRNA guanosine(15) transglycosylase TgtA [Euryarchaeota archaeon]|nr:tRNA guanosine(15) transglycosylase TgtA [Euryarchaeota archaeon]
MFELRHRDAMGRLGTLEAGGRRMETPALLPVVSPKLQKIKLRELREMGFEGVITNSYLIHRDEGLREKALKGGVHRLLDYDGLVMTDSGSYQLYEYGRVEIGAREIVEFQDAIGTDIGVILDIPTPPDVTRERALAELEETLSRAQESVGVERRCLLAGTVQGSTHPDLREESARRMGSLGFDLHPIGGVVPLMEAYRFRDLADVILRSKLRLPPERPVHLFGCGHPMIFSFAAALGCDLFDSAAYALYAKDGRYMTPEGTLRLEEMYTLPCTCPVCSRYEAQELRAMDIGEREVELARHNLYASLQEIKRVRQAIHEGSLWALVEQRARSHPRLLEALTAALGYEVLERSDPVTKGSPFFYSGEESLQRPEVRRHFLRLRELDTQGRELVLLPEGRRSPGPASGKKYHICRASPVFGVVPQELEDVYPLGSYEGPSPPTGAQVGFMQAAVAAYAKGFGHVHTHSSLDLGIGETFEDPAGFGPGDVETKLRGMADYQFGRGAGRLLVRRIRVEWARTGRMRRLYSGKKLLATVRASDGFYVLGMEGAKRLLGLPAPRNRVVVDKEAGEFVGAGRNAFAKFVRAADPEIRPHQEVLVVDGDDSLLATGRALLNGPEMLAFRRGIAVRVRHGLRDEEGEAQGGEGDDDPG